VLTDSLGNDLDCPLLLGGAMFTAVDHRRRTSVNIYARTRTVTQTNAIDENAQSGLARGLVKS